MASTNPVGHLNLVYDLEWSDDNELLLSASSDGTARVWDTTKFSAAPLKTLPHPCFVYCARFRPGAKSREVLETGGLQVHWHRGLSGIAS